MPELLLELFSEEIPARMQARGAEDLVRLVSDALAPLSPRETRGFFGPRRIALSGDDHPASGSAHDLRQICRERCGAVAHHPRPPARAPGWNAHHSPRRERLS